MKIISWNVNGIRSVMKKGFASFVKRCDPDILCLQETKAPARDNKAGEKAWKEINHYLDGTLDHYNIYWNSAQKPGYSGTAVFSKTEPLSIVNGLGVAKHDSEGRVITAEYKDFYVVNVYTPNSKRELERLPYREKEWDPDFLKHCKNLEKKKPVIFCGDLNVAHTEIDLTYPKQNMNNHGFTPEERKGFDNIVKAGFVDTFREFEKGGGHYTWWSPMSNSRAKNVGWRIDYFCVSESLKKKLKAANILSDVMGSDHCPVEIILK